MIRGFIRDFWSPGTPCTQVGACFPEIVSEDELKDDIGKGVYLFGNL